MQFTPTAIHINYEHAVLSGSQKVSKYFIHSEVYAHLVFFLKPKILFAKCLLKACLCDLYFNIKVACFNTVI